MTLVFLIEQDGDAPEGPTRLATQFDRLAGRTRLHVEYFGGIGQPTGTRLRALSTELDRCAERGVAVALATPSLVTPDAVLLRLVDDPSLVIGALIASAQVGHRVATQGSTVLAASTALHPVAGADAGSLGLVYFCPGVLHDVADAIRRAVQDYDGPSWDGLDLLDLLLAVIIRSAASGLPAVTAVRTEPFPGARVENPDEVESARSSAAAADTDLAERTSARAGDGWYSTFVLRRISRRVTPWAVRRGIAANTVTTASAMIGIGGAVAFALGTYPALVTGAVLLQVSLVLDCVDGEIARSTRTRTAFGGWLDGVSDRVKEYAALAGLALAGAHVGQHLWTLAAAGMVAQTVRHMQDFSFDKGVLAAWRASFGDVRPLSDTTPWQRPVGSAPGPEQLGGSAGMWMRRVIRMPIGERWLVLCLAALVDQPRLGLLAYFVLALLAQGWTLLGAIRRTTAAVGDYGPSLRRRLADLRDDGLLDLLTRGRSPGGVAGWFLPAFVTLVEGGAVVAVTAACAPHWASAAFGWFAVVAWHRYDLVYRRGSPAPSVPVGVARLGGGWLLRSAVVLGAAAGGVLPAVLVIGIGWLAVVYVPESLRNGARTLENPGRRSA